MFPCRWESYTRENLNYKEDVTTKNINTLARELHYLAIFRQANIRNGSNSLSIKHSLLRCSDLLEKIKEEYK